MEKELPLEREAEGEPASVGTHKWQKNWGCEIDIQQDSPSLYSVKKNGKMNVDIAIHMTPDFQANLMEEVEKWKATQGTFTPALIQLSNVSMMPGIFGKVIGLPDIHAGYGFAIGSVGAFDMSRSEAVVSPGGVGYDINCGVRLIRTNLLLEDMVEKKRDLIDLMYKTLPTGFSKNKSEAGLMSDTKGLTEVLKYGLDHLVASGYSWVEDRDHAEANGRLLTSKINAISSRAFQRGQHQVGSVGSGNHYVEVQVVDEVFDPVAAKAMGIDTVGQVCVMIHTGSRGLGHQVATDYIKRMREARFRANKKDPDYLPIPDPQLECARVNTELGQAYLGAMSAAANFAWANRGMLTHYTRKCFQTIFNEEPDDLDMCLVYDVSHNIASRERHWHEGKPFELLVHRKGATRAFPPHHPLVPLDYQTVGQPVIVGGSMGTCSYILTGTETGMTSSFGSTCHGAGMVWCVSE
eukprot:GHVU01053070.1.p1 GENE.GHVU01053070.1~~GHVU01053070.1.p1  ORF type:complete len:465 (+),score=66.61 GHVU01053070.1:186-1580(+)